MVETKVKFRNHVHSALWLLRLEAGFAIHLSERAKNKLAVFLFQNLQHTPNCHVVEHFVLVGSTFFLSCSFVSDYREIE